MSQNFCIIKSVRTGNMFVSDYFIFTGQERLFAGQEKLVTGMHEVIKFIREGHKRGDKFDTYKISEDVKKYTEYVRERIALSKVPMSKNARERAMDELELEIGREDFSKTPSSAWPEKCNFDFGAPLPANSHTKTIKNQKYWR